MDKHLRAAIVTYIPILAGVYIFATLGIYAEISIVAGIDAANEWLLSYGEKHPESMLTKNGYKPIGNYIGMFVGLLWGWWIAQYFLAPRFLADKQSNKENDTLKTEQYSAITQEFRLEKIYFALAKAFLMLFIALLAFWVYSVSLSDEHKYDIVSDTASGILFFAITIYLTWAIWKHLPFLDVAADHEGIWYMHIGKNKGLIAWNKIHGTKERHYMQKMDILDCNNKKLLGITYYLHDFERLRDFITEKTDTIKPISNQSKFAKSRLGHLAHLAQPLFISAGGIYLYASGLITEANGNPLLFFGILIFGAIFSILQYLTTVMGIQITNTSFLILYPLTRKNIPFRDIEDIAIADIFHQGSRIPEVRITSKNAKKPFRLKGLGVDANVLYKSLRKAAKL